MFSVDVEGWDERQPCRESETNRMLWLERHRKLQEVVGTLTSGERSQDVILGL
jgi:hypothetical protein